MTTGSFSRASAPAEIKTTGRVSAKDKQYLADVLLRAQRLAPEDVLWTTAHLSANGERGLGPCRARVSMSLDGDVIRAETNGEDLQYVIDELGDRLRRQFERRRDRHRHDPRGRPAPSGTWRHGNLAAERPPYFDRPIAERLIVRHKSFDTGRSTLDEARWDREQMDYDFYLFRNDATGATSVLEGDGENERVIEVTDVTAMTVEEALARLNATNDRFVFFRDRRTDDGALIYRRYDGHYGLIRPR